jgi:hypothetical protein
VSTRTARVATTVTASALTVLLTAAPALADNPIGPQSGEEREPSLGLVTTLLLYVGVPVAVALVMFAVVWLPGVVRTHRYRPGKAWEAEPVWFAGPTEPLAAVASAEAGDVVRGGARGSW